MFPNQIVYDLGEDSFIGGNERIYTFNIYDSGSSAVNLTNCSLGWRMSYFGQSGSTILSKSGSFSGSPTNRFTVTLGLSDTQSLSGKFVQQPFFTDGSGNEFRPSQGIINIYPRNP